MGECDDAPAVRSLHGRRRARLGLRVAPRGDAGDVSQSRELSVGDSQLDVPLAVLKETGDVLQRDEPAPSDDRHAIADALDLREDVRREEDRSARRAKLVEDRVERSLHQRIEALEIDSPAATAVKRVADDMTAALAAATLVTTVSST